MKGREAVELDRATFQAIVSNLETEHQFTSRSALWEAVASTDWARCQQPRPLTAQVARLRADALGIEVKTPKGKIGRASGTVVPRRTKKRIPLELVQAMKAEVPESFRHVIDKLANGSLKAAIKAKCLECSAFQPIEVRICHIKTCPLHPFRPFQQKP